MARLTARETIGSTKAHFEALNQQSAKGVIYVEEDTGVIKVGNGVDNYVDLAALSGITHEHGFADYNDTSTSTTPLSIEADTWTDLPNDGLGPFSQEQLPASMSGGLLGAGGAIDISSMPAGSDILIRQDFTVFPSNNNAALAFRYKLGSGAGEYTLSKSLGRLDQGAGIGYPNSLTTDYVYSGDANTKDNPIQPQIKMSSAGTVVNAGMAIKIYKAS